VGAVIRIDANNPQMIRIIVEPKHAPVVVFVGGHEITTTIHDFAIDMARNEVVPASLVFRS